MNDTVRFFVVLAVLAWVLWLIFKPMPQEALVTQPKDYAVPESPDDMGLEAPARAPRDANRFWGYAGIAWLCSCFLSLVLLPLNAIGVLDVHWALLTAPLWLPTVLTFWGFLLACVGAAIVHKLESRKP